MLSYRPYTACLLVLKVFEVGLLLLLLFEGIMDPVIDDVVFL